jgi:hypothetical protein
LRAYAVRCFFLGKRSMRRTIFAVFALTTAGIAWSAAPAFAGYGAIAYGDNSGRRGVAWDYDTQQKPDDAALRDCGAGCKVVVRFGAKICAAIATPESGKGIGAASRPTIDEAKSAALSDCKAHNSSECVVRDARCNR